MSVHTNNAPEMLVHVVGTGTLSLAMAQATDSTPGLAEGEVVVVQVERRLDNGVVRKSACAASAPGAALFVRCASATDMEIIAGNAEAARAVLRRIADRMRNAQVSFKPIDAGYSFGREKLSILFGSETQIPPTQLREHVPADVMAEVDFRQVGIRDECALIGGIGPCGRSFCCCDWQKYFNPVNIRMAKSQEMPLTPSTLNGVCDRLKCCLHFEYEQYLEAAEGLPTYGMVVEGAGVHGRVVGRDVLRGILTIRTADNRHIRAPYASLKLTKEGR